MKTKMDPISPTDANPADEYELVLAPGEPSELAGLPTVEKRRARFMREFAAEIANAKARSVRYANLRAEMRECKTHLEINAVLRRLERGATNA